MLHGGFTYYSSEACATAGKFSRSVCAHAQANAEAEFEEKAPHFPTRAACERAYGRGQCALSLRASARISGARGGVSFTIRQQGFRIVARSDTDVTTTPVARGLMFSARSALYRRTSIDPRAVARAAPHPTGATASAQTSFGVSNPPAGAAGPMPPPVRYDPNFNCADYIDPATKGDPNAACAPAPEFRR